MSEGMGAGGQAAPASLSRPRGALAVWLAATRISLGSSRVVITIPIYVLLGFVCLLPLGMLAYLLLPFNPRLSVFDSFLGDFLAAPHGAPQVIAGFFYFYLYLMSYLSIASVIGYEERRDRSIMFWKSLPVGDGTWIAGQVTALFIAFGIGMACLLAVCTVLSVWEHFYLLGLNYPQEGFLANYADMVAGLLGFAKNALLILFLSLPFGVSMLWFATFCRRQPGGYWLGTFVSAYLVAFFLRYIGIDGVEPLLWYPENFVRTAYWLLAYDVLPEVPGGVPLMAATSVVATLVFACLALRARRKAMPVS